VTTGPTEAEMEGSIRVLIAEGHRLPREGLELMLNDEDGIEVVGNAVNGVQAINLVDELKPDVVLLDISLPEIDGIQAILPIRQKSPHTKVLMFTPAEDENTVFKLLKAGAKGYFSDESAVFDVPKAIRAVHRGELWVGRTVVSRFVDHETIAGSNGENPRSSRETLTPREQEVLTLLTTGSTNKEIAQDLFISEKTVKCHVNNIFKKLNVTRRLQAVLYAMGKGLG
jgi:DNA-binding NarL/FixJ family response regulator